MNGLKDTLIGNDVDILVEEGIDLTKNHQKKFIQSLKVISFDAHPSYRHTLQFVVYLLNIDFRRKTLEL